MISYRQLNCSVICLFLGYLGIHKFYEGRILLGILYIFTGGLFGIGVIVDLVILFFKPNPYFP
ncbi:MAG: NINE protein [Acutalibacteraceae bacterium]